MCITSILSISYLKPKQCHPKWEAATVMAGLNSREPSLLIILLSLLQFSYLLTQVFSSYLELKDITILNCRTQIRIQQAHFPFFFFQIADNVLHPATIPQGILHTAVTIKFMQEPCSALKYWARPSIQYNLFVGQFLCWLQLVYLLQAIKQELQMIAETPWGRHARHIHF